MERAEARCRYKPSGGFHRRPGRSREPMGAQPDTSTSAPEVWHGVLQILAPIFVPRLLATYLVQHGPGATVCVAGGPASTAWQASQVAKTGNTTSGVCVTPNRIHVSQTAVCDTEL